MHEPSDHQQWYIHKQCVGPSSPIIRIIIGVRVRVKVLGFWVRARVRVKVMVRVRFTV